MPTRSWLLITSLVVALVLGYLWLKLAVPKMGRVPPVSSEGPPPVGPKLAVVVVHGPWRVGTDALERSGVRCPRARLVDGEIEALRMLLARRGYALYVEEADALDPVAIAAYDLVVHHNGGFGSPVGPAEVAALAAARAAGRPLLFLGDDVGTALAASPELLREAGIAEVVGQGRASVSLVRPDRETWAGTYARDPDEVRLLGGAVVRLQDELGLPIAWTAGRVAVAQASLRSSDLCPVADELGTALLDGVVGELVSDLTER